MPSTRTEIEAEVRRLAREGIALLRGLSVAGGQLDREELRASVKKQIQDSDAERKAAGKSKPKGRIDDRVDALMDDFVLSFHERYEGWYTESHAVVAEVLPDRLDDFRAMYKTERRKELDVETYSLSDYQLGLSVTRGPLKEQVFDPNSVAIQKFERQRHILGAAEKMLESRLADISGVLQADLFDSEIDAARELLANGYVRAAGMVGGVVLESHLSHVAFEHSLSIRAKKPTIATYNDALKDGKVFGVSSWRFVQHLGDLRNLCGHSGDREPTRDDVQELLDGVDKIVKTVS